MKKTYLTLIFLLCAIKPAWSQEGKSFSQYLSNSNLEELPMELDIDDQGHWREIWHREKGKFNDGPSSIMEQGIGLKWIGLEPNKKGRPNRIILIYAQKHIVDLNEEKSRIGKIDEDKAKIVWSDGEQQILLAPKKRSRRRRGGKAINFGKITLPPIVGKTKEKQTADNFLKLRFLSSCSSKSSAFLQKELIEKVEPKLTCWAEQNHEQAQYLFAALLQGTQVSCKTMSEENCGEATLPLGASYFAIQPQININMNRCQEDSAAHLSHELMHLAGIKDGVEMDKALAQMETCKETAARLNFEGESEEFMNDLQVETRLILFRKIREEATEKWGWSEGDKNYALGEVCNKMGDKFCARRFFQLATEEQSMTAIPLPEGGTVSFKSAAYFGFYDSISEDFPRMHGLAKYLTHDPVGTLLKRLETSTHRLHEFFLARAALEKTKNNRGVCNSQNDDKVSCEDLLVISRSSWFRGL